MEKKYNSSELILSYISMKLQEGYKPFCSVEEISDFLDFITYFIALDCDKESYGQIVHNLLESPVIKQANWESNDGISYPIIEGKEDIIYPTYYFMNVLEIDEKLKEYIKAYLRKSGVAFQVNVPENIYFTEEQEEFGSNVASTLLLYVWDEKLRKMIFYQQWPKQCTDIYKYLIEADLASAIGLPEMRTSLLKFYNDVKNRVTVLSQDDPNFQLSNFSYRLLSKANFDAVMKGYQYIESIAVYSRNLSYIIVKKSGNVLERWESLSSRQRTMQKLNEPRAVELARILNKI